MKHTIRLIAACGILMFGLSACATKAKRTLHAPRVHDVTITVSPESVSVKAPQYIGSGDSVRVNVRDRVFANRYVVRDSQATLTPLEVSAMTGDTSLKVMSLGFAPTLIQSAPRSQPQVDQLAAIQRIEPEPFLRDPGGDYRHFVRLISLVDEWLIAASDTTARTLDTLRTQVRADRGEYARITLLANSDWQTTAQGLAGDSAAVRAQRQLKAAAESTADSLLSPTELYSLRAQLELYGRRLDLFRASLPAEPPTSLSDTSRVPGLMGRLALLAEKDLRLRTQRDSLVTEALEAAEQAEITPRIPAAPPAAPPLYVVGMNLSNLLRTQQHFLSTLDTARVRLDRVNQATVRVVTAVNQLPRWTMTSSTPTVFTSLYPAEKEVRVVVMRRNRFAPWGTGAAETTPKPASTTSSSGTTTVTTTTTVTQGSAAAAAPSGSAGSATAGMPLVVVPRQDDTVALLTIPVLQRYRYRLGVGMIFSTLRSPALETTAGKVNGDTGVYVQRTGRNEHRFVPVALLSTTLYPLEGRFVDGRARRYPFQNPSISLQTGISLQNPTEHLYAGLAFEPMQGVEIGGGLHFGYVETTTYASGTFVPFSQGSATASQWKTAWAGTVTLDATTIVRAFGGLLGL